MQRKILQSLVSQLKTVHRRKYGEDKNSIYCFSHSRFFQFNNAWQIRGHEDDTLAFENAINSEREKEKEYYARGRGGDFQPPGRRKANCVRKCAVKIGRPLKTPPANSRTYTFSVLKCTCRYYNAIVGTFLKKQICNIGGVKNKIDSNLGPRYV